jgi:hypothetical protein
MTEQKGREQNISGLSFRNLSNDLDFSNPDNPEFIFVDTEIAEDKDLTWIRTRCDSDQFYLCVFVGYGFCHHVF